MDFSILHSTKPIHPIVLRIEQQMQSLLSLIHSNRGFFQEENKKLDEWKSLEVDKVYKDFEGKPKDLITNEEDNVNSQYDWQKQILWNTENDFYHATFILAYSYFESIVSAICKDKAIVADNHIDNKVKAILCHCKSQFKATTQIQYNYVVGDLKKVRNLLTHNYNGTNKQEQLDAASREHAKSIGFEKVSDESFVVRFEYVVQTLNNLYPILKELSTMLNL